MKKEEIHLWDFKRILFGQAPPEFLIEVFIRTLIIYLATLVVLRLLVKRMSGQLTITELAVMITLGAIIAVPMQSPERGLLQGLLALLCALVFQRGFNLMGFKNQQQEKLTQGQASLLVKDGVLLLDQMEKAVISRQQLFTAIRNKKIYQLGKIKRMYLEGCGIFSIYSFKEPKPGLSVLPPTDEDVLKTLTAAPGSQKVCSNCGTAQEITDIQQPCNNCGQVKWIQAVI